MPFATSDALSDPANTSAILIPNAKAVPGPRLVIKLPSCTKVLSSTYLKIKKKFTKNIFHYNDAKGHKDVNVLITAFQL